MRTLPPTPRATPTRPRHVASTAAWAAAAAAVLAAALVAAIIAAHALNGALQ